MEATRNSYKHTQEGLSSFKCQVSIFKEGSLRYKYMERIDPPVTSVRTIPLKVTPPVILSHNMALPFSAAMIACQVLLFHEMTPDVEMRMIFLF